jgi:hypothetical protein
MLTRQLSDSNASGVVEGCQGDPLDGTGVGVGRDASQAFGFDKRQRPGAAAPSSHDTAQAAGRWFESIRGRFSQSLSFQPKSLSVTGFWADSLFRLLLARASP